MTGSAATLRWLGIPGPARICPNCASEGGTRAILWSAAPAGGNAAGHELLGCNVCGCAFFDPPPAFDYSGTPPGAGAALAFYLQQGAGLWSIASALLSLDLPGPRRLTEIGCGYGFGLDVARRALGWEVRGYDPSPFAAAGREQLNLPITLDYFRADAAVSGQEDVVLCSELIEHVEHPGELLTTLRRALRPGGVLVLTTPNVGAVQPGTSPGLLVPLLSVGYHTVLQSAASLERVLRDVGFRTVEVSERGASLYAQATDGPAAWHAPGPADQARYVAWLEATAAVAPMRSDLRLGLLGRIYREAISAGDRDAADRAITPLAEECRGRFGLDFDAEEGAVVEPTSLERLIERMPLSMGALLLHRGYHRLLLGERRPALIKLFDRAGDAADALRNALAGIGVDDGDAEIVAWTARAEAVLASAEAGAADTIERLASLGATPEVGGDGGRERDIRSRAFVSLVNAGGYAAARQLTDVVEAATEHAERSSHPLADTELDVLYCASIIEANTPEGSATRGVHLVRLLRGAATRALELRPGGSAAVLLWPAVTLELLLLERLDRGMEAHVLVTQGIAALATLPHAPPKPPAGSPA